MIKKLKNNDILTVKTNKKIDRDQKILNNSPFVYKTWSKLMPIKSLTTFDAMSKSKPVSNKAVEGISVFSYSVCMRGTRDLSFNAT